MIAIKAPVQKIYNLALSTVLPPCCPGCDDATLNPYVFCAKCWAKINFIQKPYCSCCGMPMPYEDGTLVCVACLAYPPHFDQGRCVSHYEGLMRDLALKLKHGDATYLPRSLSSWLVEAGKEFWLQTDYLIPVPLHRWRLVRRRYNQATLLARAIAKRTKLPVLNNILIRHKATASQGHKTRQERVKNVQGAFTVKDSHGLLNGKTVTLIDDVWTTGATLEACAKVLKKAGVSTVNVLALARVVQDM